MLRGKCIIWLGLNGTERTTIIDVYNIIQIVRDTVMHLKGYSYSYTSVVDQEPKSSRGPQQQRSERQVSRERTYTCHNATTRLLHNTNSKSANKSLPKA